MLLVVPVKPFVKEFFSSKEMFGPDAIEVRRNHYLGEMVAAVFGHYPLQTVDQADLEPSLKGRNTELVFDLTFPIKPDLITDYHLLQFSAMLEVAFGLFAMGFVNGRMDILASLNGASNAFVKKYDLSPESYSPDSIRKVVTRSRVKQRGLLAAAA